VTILSNKRSATSVLRGRRGRTNVFLLSAALCLLLTLSASGRSGAMAARVGTAAKKCVVPKVKGLALRPAKKKIRHAHCRVGKIRRRTSTLPGMTNHVLSQAPRWARSLSAGTRVNLVVANGPTPARSPWTTVVNDDFKTLTALPSHWCTYRSHDRVYGGNYAPAHVYVSGGYLHLLQKYESNGAFGTGWYSGAIALTRNPSGGCGGSNRQYPFPAANSRLTVRMRLVETGSGRAASHRNILRWPNSGVWPSDGEEDMWESDVSTSRNVLAFFHYGSDNRQIYWRYPALDLTRWHTFRFQRLDSEVSLYVDDLTTPIHVYHGSSTTLPPTAKHWVFQQQCPSSGCPARNSDTEDWQIAWIAVANA